MKPFRSMVLGLVLGAVVTAAAAAPAAAYVDPAWCTQSVTYAPGSEIPTFESVVGRPLGDGPTGSTGRNPTAKLYQYFDAMVAATANNPAVKVIRKSFGTSVMGQDLRFYVISTPDNMDNLDAGRADGPFWEGIKDGSVPEADGLAAAGARPAFGWITATPHGGEAAAGEAISRMLYELAARRDCWNARRLHEMDLFLMPVRNPDGRDAPPGGVRTSAWAFDHNRDFGTQNQQENATFLPLLKRYPGLFYIDAHQQGSGYFFPPNEDPVHHEISDFSLDFIQNRIGPALQQKFNDQSVAYQNYNSYDLFTPEYGDTVPSLLSGAAGMTYEKGSDEVYGKQVYDHYLAIDETVNVTVRDKNALLADWTAQWQEAVDQGARCELQPNKLVSPLHTVIEQQVPTGPQVCGYFYRPDNHAGDAAELIRHMQRQGVHVFRFDAAARVAGVHEFGAGGMDVQTLPAGTLYIPMDQPLKHWIQAVLGEDPYIPFSYFYDVVQWSYSLQRGMSGNGFLQLPPSGVKLTEIADPGWGAAPATPKPVYAFDTDSMRGLALSIDLLERGATVYRAREPFDAAGKHFETGAALVDGESVAASGIDLAALADARQTLVSGLTGYPVDAYAMETPKIGLYTGAAIEPNNPVRPLAGSAYPRHCGVQPQGVSGTTYCAALFVLTQKIGLPAAMVTPITTTDLAAGDLVSEDYTALINPSATIAAGAGATALQAFVNAGGRYVGGVAGGTTSARNAGLTTLNTNAIAGITTPGSFFSADFDTDNPVAWGFDTGGFIYRESSNDPNYDPATLAGDGGAIPPATAAISYTTPVRSFGYEVGATAPGGLEGRPVVVDQPFGAGHAIMLGFESFFRAWREHDERLILNAVLYPGGPLVTPSVTARAAPVAGQGAAAAPVAKAALPKVRTRRLAGVNRSARDVRIKVARRDGRALRRAVRTARLPKRVQRKVRWRTTRRTVTLVVRRARTSANDHDRGIWVGRITQRLDRARVKVLLGQF